QVEGGQIGEDLGEVGGRKHERNLLRGNRMFGDDTATVLSCEGAARRHHGPPARERGRRLLCRREFEPPAKTANKTAKPLKRRKAKVAAAEPASEQRVEAESKSSKHVMTFKIPL